MKHTQWAIQHRTSRRWVASDVCAGVYRETGVEAEAYRYDFASTATMALEMCGEFADAYDIVPVRAEATS